MGMTRIKKAHMFILMVQDKKFEDTVQFYKDLGLTSKFHLKDKWSEFELDGLLIGICPTDKELPDRHTGIVMAVDDLQATHDELKSSVTFLNKPVEAVHGLMASVKDPGGNIFDLYQPTPDKLKDFVKKTAEKDCCENKDCCEDKKSEKN